MNVGDQRLGWVRNCGWWSWWGFAAMAPFADFANLAMTVSWMGFLDEVKGQDVPKNIVVVSEGIGVLDNIMT